MLCLSMVISQLLCVHLSALPPKMHINHSVPLPETLYDCSATQHALNKSPAEDTPQSPVFSFLQHIILTYLFLKLEHTKDCKIKRDLEF